VPFTLSTNSVESAATTKDFAYFNNNGSVDLYYDNVKKFETSADGVTITGDTAVSGNITAGTGTVGGLTFAGTQIASDDSSKISFQDSIEIANGPTISTAAITSDSTFDISNFNTRINPTFQLQLGNSNTNTVLIGSGSNTVDFPSGTAVDFTGATVTGLSTGGASSRSTATGTTGSLADAAEADLDITGFKSYMLLTVTTDRAARVRLYTTGAASTADASTAAGTDPTSDAGVIAEVITTGAQTVTISPGALGFNLEGTPTTNIPTRVTNKSGGTSTVQVTLNILQLEA